MELDGEFRAVLWIGLGGDDWKPIWGVVPDQAAEVGISAGDGGMRGVADLRDRGGKHAERDLEFDLHRDQYSRLGEVEEEPAERVCAGRSLILSRYVARPAKSVMA